VDDCERKVELADGVQGLQNDVQIEAGFCRSLGGQDPLQQVNRVGDTRKRISISDTAFLRLAIGANRCCNIAE
jgi:hypothetical protein